MCKISNIPWENPSRLGGHLQNVTLSNRVFRQSFTIIEKQKKWRAEDLPSGHQAYRWATSLATVIVASKLLLPHSIHFCSTIHTQPASNLQQPYFLFHGFSICSTRNVFVDSYCTIPFLPFFICRFVITKWKVGSQGVRFELTFRAFSTGNVEMHPWRNHLLRRALIASRKPGIF